MRNYTQITPEQRRLIYAVMEVQHSQTEIAKQLDIHKFAVNHETR